MDIRIGEVEARTIRDGLRTLLRVVHIQRQVLRWVVGAARVDVRHARDFITAIAPVVAVWVNWRRCASGWIACARVGRVEVAGTWARIDIPQTRAKVGSRHLVELIERSDQPWARAVVAVVVVVGGGKCKRGVALGALATARLAARVLDREHLHARLDSAVATDTRAGASSKSGGGTAANTSAAGGCECVDKEAGNARKLCGVCFDRRAIALAQPAASAVDGIIVYELRVHVR